MPLRDEIELVRDQAIFKLNSSHDYYIYTKRAWKTLRRLIRHDGLAFTWRNRSTKSQMNQVEILSHSRLYMTVDLTSSTLLQFVSIFENFLSDVMSAWLREHHKSLSNRQLSGKDIFELPDKAAIINALVEKEIKDVFYDRPHQWFKYLKNLVNIAAPTDSESEQFAEIKATRDVFVHGQGIANAYYFEKAGRRARASIGQPLDIQDSYHQESWEMICKLANDIGTEMAAKA